MPKHFLGFHTVFILNENIRWLEEFLIYYINLGVDQFYLYENDGTSGHDGTEIANKYGFPISSTATQEDRNAFNALLAKYGKYITHVLWQPRNAAGQIIYGQSESVADCIQKYGADTEWIAFLDTDEFIFSEQSVSLPEVLRALDPTISAVKLVQKKFLDRFLTSERLITQEYRCINSLTVGTEWAPKNIVRCRDFVSVGNIHNIRVKQRTVVLQPQILRFNHYNLNDKQLEWMKSFYKRSTPFVIDGVDDGMKRVRHIYGAISG